jgi:hypothetical protein
MPITALHPETALVSIDMQKAIVGMPTVHLAAGMWEPLPCRCVLWPIVAKLAENANAGELR